MVLTISSDDKTKLIIQNCLVNIYYISSDQYEQHTCQIGAWNHFLTLHHIKNGKDSFNSYRFRYFFFISCFLSMLFKPKFSKKSPKRNLQYFEPINNFSVSGWKILKFLLLNKTLQTSAEFLKWQKTLKTSYDHVAGYFSRNTENFSISC